MSTYHQNIWNYRRHPLKKSAAEDTSDQVPLAVSPLDSVHHSVPGSLTKGKKRNC